MKTIFSLALICAGILAPVGPAQTLLVQHNGGASFPTLGSALVALEDITGDGVPDFASAGLVDAPQGAVLPQDVRLRAYSGVDGTQVFEYTTGGFPLGPMRVSLTTLGDLTGDGVDEIVLAIAETGNSSTLVGRVEIIEGTGAGLLYVLGGALHPRFGWSVEDVGDVDGDGVDDLAVGAPAFTLIGVGVWGATVSFFSGATGTPLPVSFVQGTGNLYLGPTTGSNILYLPSFDAAAPGPVMVLGVPGLFHLIPVTLPNLVVGSPLNPCTSGAGASTVPVGREVVDMGDIDGDGASDLATLGTASTGTGLLDLWVSVMTGAGTVCAATVNLQISGGFSPQLAAIADQNGDGIRDLAIGDPFQVRLHSGFDGSFIGMLSPGPAGVEAQVAALGDITGDGVGEILVGYGSAGVLQVWTLEPTAAQVQTLGSGFSGGPLVPVLQSGLPLLGAPLGLFLNGAFPFSSGWLVVAPGPAVPTVIQPGFVVHPDPTRIAEWALIPFTANIGGGSIFPFVVPFDFRLVGTELILQAWFATSFVPGLPSVTNGLRLRVGL